MPLETDLLLPLLPLDDRVILPHMTVPVAVDSEAARAAVRAARQPTGLACSENRGAGSLLASAPSRTSTSPADCLMVDRPRSLADSTALS